MPKKRFSNLTLAIVLFACGGFLFGSLWQIEISIINGLNGWPFMYLFNMVQVGNWEARDFFYLVIGLTFLLTVAVAYHLGRNEGLRE